ncbi:hypothetical protein K1T71_002507 [Dendrolimus kikuchii]|uniref:Uncharacterized protein n=1 Tax=Dendrolimus kikuchii TaxID=765133 RepID=A0ACC1DD57_9NEOP|nr:hypothetical protein K1T71_002507 [Dendrolimus kikuchii]
MALGYHIKHNVILYLYLRFSNQLRTYTYNSVSISNENKRIRNLTNQEDAIINSCVEDLSTVAPYFPKSFNLAAYTNGSETLQKLIKLNVDLSKIEKKPHVAEKLLQLDINSNMNGHILFLSDFVKMENMGIFITKNPMIFYQNIDDLKVRVNYLMSKRFSDEQIKYIIWKNPFWLMFSTVRIDRRLGYFQEKFKLTGEEIRNLASKKPSLITYNLKHVLCNLFIIKEEMGFQDHEMKHLIMNKPKLWMINDKALLQRFDYIHNVMNISHARILKEPEILLCRNFRIKQRHLFLQNRGRAQYDPLKENFIPLKALFEGTDTEFCKKYAKCNATDFNDFLKTL